MDKGSTNMQDTETTHTWVGLDDPPGRAGPPPASRASGHPSPRPWEVGRCDRHATHQDRLNKTSKNRFKGVRQEARRGKEVHGTGMRIHTEARSNVV